VAAGEGGAGGEAGVAACSLNASASCSLGGADACTHVISPRGGDAGRHCPFAPVRTPHNAGAG